MDQHEIQTEVNPTGEQWLALHHAFRSYCEARPWERLSNEDVLVVNDPLGRFRGYCVALGDGGVAYGRRPHRPITQPLEIPMDNSIAYSYTVGQAVKSWLLPDGLYQVRICQGQDLPVIR